MHFIYSIYDLGDTMDEKKNKEKYHYMLKVCIIYILVLFVSHLLYIIFSILNK